MISEEKAIEKECKTNKVQKHKEQKKDCNRSRLGEIVDILLTGELCNKREDRRSGYVVEQGVIQRTVGAV